MKNLHWLHSKVVLVEKLHGCFVWSRKSESLLQTFSCMCNTIITKRAVFACVSFFSFLAEWLPGLQRFPLTHSRLNKATSLAAAALCTTAGGSVITHGELFRLLVWCLANTNPHYACLNSGSEFTRRSRGGAGTLASLPLLSQKWNIWQLKLVIIRGTKRLWRRVQLTTISLFESDGSQVHCVCRVCFIWGGKKDKKNLLNEKSWLQIAAHISVLCWWDFIVQLLKAEGGGY